MKDMPASKKPVYKSHTRIWAAFLVPLGFYVYTLYRDFISDGLLFNEGYRYNSTWVFVPVGFVFIFFYYTKIIIIDDELIIYYMRLRFWKKPYRIKIANIKSVYFYNNRIASIKIKYQHEIYDNAICEKEFIYAITGNSRKRLISKFKEYGVPTEVYGQIYF